MEYGWAGAGGASSLLLDGASPIPRGGFATPVAGAAGGALGPLRPSQSPSPLPTAAPGPSMGTAADATNELLILRDDV